MIYRWINKKLDLWAERRLYKKLKKREMGKHWWAFTYWLTYKARIMEGTMRFKEGDVVLPITNDEVPFQHITISFDSTNSELINEWLQKKKSDIPISMLESEHTFGRRFLETYIDLYGERASLEETTKLFNMYK